MTVMETALPNDLAGVFRAASAAQPEAPFLHFGSRVWTYSDMAADARALASAFQDVGVEKGDRIAVNLPNLKRAAAIYFTRTVPVKEEESSSRPKTDNWKITVDSSQPQ